MKEEQAIPQQSSSPEVSIMLEEKKEKKHQSSMFEQSSSSAGELDQAAVPVTFKSIPTGNTNLDLLVKTLKEYTREELER
jgi:hypothetical protein